MSDVRAGMRPMQGVRLRNLQNLVKVKFKGNATACATAIGRSHTFLWQLLNEYRSIGEASARHIEEKLGLERGKLDAHDVLEADRKLVAQMGNGETTSYWMVPYVDLFALPSRRKKTNKKTEGEAMPCPVDCSEATVYVRVPNAAMEPLFKKGELVFADPNQTKIEDGASYVVTPIKGGGVGVIRLARKLERGGFLFVTIDERLKSEAFKDREVLVFGRVILALRKVECQK